MVCRRGLVSFMDRNSRVDNFGSHSLFLDNRLDVLVNVVMPPLTGDSGRFFGGEFGVVDGRSVLVLGCVTLK